MLPLNIRSVTINMLDTASRLRSWARWSLKGKALIISSSLSLTATLGAFPHQNHPGLYLLNHDSIYLVLGPGY